MSDKQRARRHFNTFFQNTMIGNQPIWKRFSTRRAALCFFSSRKIVAYSGRFLQDLIDNSDYTQAEVDYVLQRFSAMVASYGVTRIEDWTIANCAESNLWMMLELVAMKRGIKFNRKSLAIYVTRMQKGRPRAKRDSPCNNCRQWVHQEFGSINPV